MNLLIHKVISGPHWDDEDNVLLIALVEDNGSLFEDAIYCQDEEELWSIVHHCSTKIEPYVITLEDDDEGEPLVEPTMKSFHNG